MGYIPNLSERRIWEPACGSGQMVRELLKHCPDVHGSDIYSAPTTTTRRHGNTYSRAVVLLRER